MKTFLINGSINLDFIESKWIPFINENYNDPWTIIIDSGGGSVRCAQMISRDISLKGKDCIVVCGVAYSAAFDIFRLAQNKVLLDGCRAMCHMEACDVELKQGGGFKNSEDEMIIKNMQGRDRKIAEQIAKDLMNPKEFEKYRKGEDVYFTSSRLKKIFPDAVVQ
jgi:ATP-dependent protease ClpP protease subunit